MGWTTATAPAVLSEWVREIWIRIPPASSAQPGSQAVQADGRATFGVPGDLDVTPAHATSPRQRLERLVHRLLGGDPRSRVTGRVRSGRQILPLGVGEESRERLFALAGEEARNPGEVHQVDPHAEDAQSRLHQKSVRGWSVAGTGR